MNGGFSSIGVESGAGSGTCDINMSSTRLAPDARHVYLIDGKLHDDLIFRGKPLKDTLLTTASKNLSRGIPKRVPNLKPLQYWTGSLYTPTEFGSPLEPRLLLNRAKI